MKFEAAETWLSANLPEGQKGPRLVRVRISGAPEPGDRILERARQLMRENTSSESLQFFEDAVARRLIGTK
jgi:hypothetical protein